MKKLKALISVTALVVIFTLSAESSFARKPDYQGAICSAAAAQMSQYPGREAQVCQGYPGCVFIAPQGYGGDCVVRDRRQRQALQGICNYAASAMSQSPGDEARICTGFPGCAYVPPSYSGGDCVPR